MPQSTASEFSLFEEIYGSYFQAVRRILEAGHDTPLTLHRAKAYRRPLGPSA